MRIRPASAAVIVLITALTAATYQAQPPAPPSQAPAPSSPATPPAARKQMLAEDVFRNIDTFRGKNAVRLLPAMEALRGLIGVECSYCHVPKQWDLDEKPAKPVTRRMFDMMGFINDEHFAKQNKVSCWTCHAGVPVPDKFVRDDKEVEMASGLIKVPDELKDKPAEEVFKNIHSLRGVPAGRFPLIMAFFSQSLGVTCTHCHVEGAFAKDDKPEKLTARKHLTLVTATIKKYYGGSGSLGCYTCHRGASEPQLLPPGS